MTQFISSYSVFCYPLGLMSVLQLTEIDNMRLDYVLIIISVGLVAIGLHLLNKQSEL